MVVAGMLAGAMVAVLVEADNAVFVQVFFRADRLPPVQRRQQRCDFLAPFLAFAFFCSLSHGPSESSEDDEFRTDHGRLLQLLLLLRHSIKNKTWVSGAE
jgi:hypothetical protein